MESDLDKSAILECFVVYAELQTLQHQSKQDQTEHRWTLQEITTHRSTTLLDNFNRWLINSIDGENYKKLQHTEVQNY
jgi:uncharacterized membrane protein YheB (UPF0754 family)